MSICFLNLKDFKQKIIVNIFNYVKIKIGVKFSDEAETTLKKKI